MSDQIMKASSSGEAVSAQVQVAGRAAEREKVVAITLWRRFLSSSMTGLIYVFLAVMTVFALFPIYYVIQASLAGGQNLYTTDLKLLPANPTIDNYIYVFTRLPLLNWIANTFFICAMTTLIGLTFSVSGAYALSRFRLRGREIGLNLLLAIQAFPGLLALTAYYVLLNKLGLLNSLIGLVVIYAGGSLVFGTWNMKGYFDTLPVELEQAALIDGATTTQAFLRVTLPLAAPALAASALFMFIGGWNEYALANLVLNSNATGSNLTFVLGLFALQGDFRTPWGYFAASSVVISVPLILLFLYAQRFFQSGLTIGSVKG
jgi:arabinogalactan oligomer / maltooligosaccharide transport system permease protein